MPFAFDNIYLLNLAMAGDFVDVDLSRVSEYSAEGIGNAQWGTAVVELKPVGAGGQPRSYTTGKEIDNATAAGTHNAIGASQDTAVRLVVTTADSSKGQGRIAVSGKETQ